MERGERGMGRSRLLFVAAALVVAGGCGPGDVSHVEEPPPVVPEAQDLTEQLYRPDHVLEIELTIAPADWDELRAQTRSIWDILGNSCLTPPESPFTFFPATVRVDGEVLDRVAVRKKGFYGSLDTFRPSLKIKTDEYVEQQKILGADNLTLNNNKSDASNIKQCLGYRVFAAAGIPAPRCSFAHVTVNGEDLGVYTHVEAIKKDFLGRHFSDKTGNLYEGALSDFRPGWVDTFQLKTNEEQNDRSDIESMVPVMERPDHELLQALTPRLDPDHYLTFWAVEFVVSHVDGYARNTNNYYLYHDPETDKLWFIPWGIDSIFHSFDAPLPWETDKPPWVVWAEGVLARRLYQLDPQGYFDALAHVLDTAWEDEALLAEVDRLEALLLSAVPVAQRTANGEAVQAVRDFIGNRRAEIEAQLALAPPAWNQPLRDPWCADVLGDLTASLATTWGTLGMEDPFSQGSGSLAVTLGTTPLPAPDAVTGLAGIDPNTQERVLQVVAFRSPDTLDLVHLVVNESLLVPNSSQPFDWVKASGYLVRIVFPPAGCVPPEGATECPPTFTVLGVLGDGGLVLEQASMTPGAPVVGNLTATLYEVWF
jgi:hypothetical protein